MKNSTARRKFFEKITKNKAALSLCCAQKKDRLGFMVKVSLLAAKLFPISPF